LIVTGTSLWFGGDRTAGFADTPVIVGASVSLTVTVNEHEPPVESEQITVVEPIGKNEPEDGVQITVEQLALVIGAG
jgi:hypothetical protein